MEEELEFISQSELNQIIDQCETMLRSGKQIYFDTYQFERILDYYLENGKFKKASDLAKIALSQHPDNPDIMVRQAKLYIERNNHSAALHILKTVEKLDSTNDELFFMLGVAYAGIKKIKQSEEAFQKTLSLQQTDEDKEECIYNIALSFINGSNYELAHKYLTLGNKINPNSPMVLYDLAYCAERLNELDESIECYQKYLDLEPYSENGWFNLGMIYTRQNKYDEAVSAFDFAIAINEKFSYAYFNKANALANWEKYQEAIDVYEEYLFYDNDNYLAYYYIGECYQNLDNFDKALFYYWKTIDIDKTFPDAWFGIGYIKYYKKEYEASRSFLTKAIEIDPQNPEYWYLLGNVLLADEASPKECIDAYKKALRINPSDEEYWISYSQASFHYYDADSAFRVLQNGLDYISDNAEILFFAAAYATYFDMNKARQLFDEAKMINKEESAEFFKISKLDINEYEEFKQLLNK